VQRTVAADTHVTFCQATSDLSLMAEAPSHPPPHSSATLKGEVNL
jgi:hypothetical protein